MLVSADDGAIQHQPFKIGILPHFLKQSLDRHTTHTPDHLAKSRQPAPYNNLDPEPYNDHVEYEDAAIIGLLAKQKAAIDSMAVRKDDVGVPWPRSE